MALTLLEVAAHPGEIAATKIGTSSGGGMFLLDFSRPLRTERWCLVWNFRLGYPMAVHVPVIHESETSGRLTVAVERADPYFGELQRLWNARHPRRRQSQLSPAEPSKVAEDFRRHFPLEEPVS